MIIVTRGDADREARGVEVRCCCEVARRLGWIFLPADVPIELGPYVLPTTEPDGFPGAPATLELRRYTMHFPREGDHFDQVAFASDHRPIEALRQIVGFTEDTRPRGL